MDVDNASVDLYNGGPKIPEGLVQIPEHEHPAFRAVRQSRIDLLEEYLNSGFDVNTQHEETAGDKRYCIKWFSRAMQLRGYSLLHMATIHGELEVLDFLLSKGADVNQTDESKISPVSVAAAIQREGAVKRLIQAGADLSIQSISGRTPLIQAIGIQNLPIIKMLLAAGADPNQMDSKGTTPLNTALISVDSTDMGILRILIEGGSKVNMENKQRATALMTAVGMGKHEAAQFLLDSGADVNKVDSSGKSVFHFAIGVRMALILVNNGASVDIADNRGQRALDWAAHVGHVGMLRLLLGVDCIRPSLDIFFNVPRVIQVRQSIPVFDQWLQQELNQPRELKRICRGAIRQFLGPQGLPRIDRLPIPRLMKDFLLAKRIDLSFGGLSQAQWQRMAGGEGLSLQPIVSKQLGIVFPRP